MNTKTNSPTPTVRWVRGLGAARLGWASYKHALVRAGVMVNPTDDCPINYQVAFLRACGRSDDARALLAKKEA
jgi:hypothetical protein